MKRSLWILGVVLVGLIGITGCGGGPTDPIQTPGGPGGPPAELNLTGAWTGTVTDLTGNCQSESFSVDLTQGETEPYFKGQSAKLSGAFSTPCQGSFNIQGSLVGGGLFGSISGKGRITGTATVTSIRITVVQGSGGLEGGQFPVCRLELQR